MLCTLLVGWLFCYPSPPYAEPPRYDMRHQCYGEPIHWWDPPNVARRKLARVDRLGC